MKWIDKGAKKRIFWSFEIIGIIIFGIGLGFWIVWRGENVRVKAEYEPIYKRNQEVLAMMKNGYSISGKISCYIKELDMTLDEEQCKEWNKKQRASENKQNADVSPQTNATYEEYLKAMEEKRVRFANLLSFDSELDLRGKIVRAVAVLSDAYDVDGETFIVDTISDRIKKFYAGDGLTNTDKNQLVLSAVYYAGLQREAGEVLTDAEINSINTTYANNALRQLTSRSVGVVTEDDFTDYYSQIFGETPEQGDGVSVIGCGDRVYNDDYHIYHTPGAGGCGGVPYLIYLIRVGAIVEEADAASADVYVGTVCVNSCVGSKGEAAIYKHPVEKRDSETALTNLVSKYSVENGGDYREIFNARYADFYKYTFRFEEESDGAVKFVGIE